MAGTAAGRAGRSHYSAAGYVYNESLERKRRSADLYIEKVQAGSAHDLLRDNNRIGYTAEEALDGDGLPISFFIEENERSRAREEHAREKAAPVQEIDEISGAERLLGAIRREKTAFAVCVVLCVTIVTLLALVGRANVMRVHNRDAILAYENDINLYDQQIQYANQRIAAASEPSRVRTIAQNELGMLRNERVETQTVYLQMSSRPHSRTEQEESTHERSVLDWMLSVADILDFTS